MSALLLLAAACDWRGSATRHRGTPVVLDDTLLRYPDGSTLATGLHGLAFIGQLAASAAPPFVIVAGRHCNDCDALPTVSIRSPTGSASATADELRGWHPYPGRVISSTTGTVLSHARVFWGACLPRRPDGVVTFRTDFGPEEGPLRRDVLITEVHGDSLSDWRMIPEVRLIAATLAQVRAAQCTEIPGQDMPAPP